MTASVNLLAECRCNEKADIFSYGIVLWEIITQETPQRGTLRDIQVYTFSSVFCSFLCISVIYHSFCGHIFIAAGVHCRDVVLVTKLQRYSAHLHHMAPHGGPNVQRRCMMLLFMLCVSWQHAFMVTCGLASGRALSDVSFPGVFLRGLSPGSGTWCPEYCPVTGPVGAVWVQIVPLAHVLKADQLIILVQVPEECPQAIADLVDTCLNESPAARPTAQQIFDIISSTL